MKNSDSSIKVRPSNITLIGMAGAGKSVIGKRLADMLHYDFIDIDERIEQALNLPLQEIVNRLGEEGFLRIEEKTIHELGLVHRTVISPGGSAVYSARAMAFLKERSVVIFLDAPLDMIRKQISNLDSRGIVWREKEDLNTLFQDRKPLYEKYADLTISLSQNGDVDEVMKKILEGIEKPST